MKSALLAFFVGAGVVYFFWLCLIFIGWNSETKILLDLTGFIQASGGAMMLGGIVFGSVLAREYIIN